MQLAFWGTSPRVRGAGCLTCWFGARTARLHVLSPISTKGAFRAYLFPGWVLYSKWITLWLECACGGWIALSAADQVCFLDLACWVLVCV